MTLAELLFEARHIQATGDSALVGTEVRDFALAVFDLLAEAAPCGLETPTVIDGRVYVPVTWCAAVEPDDARAMARMLLEASDEAGR